MPAAITTQANVRKTFRIHTTPSEEIWSQDCNGLRDSQRAVNVKPSHRSTRVDSRTDRERGNASRPGYRQARSPRFPRFAVASRELRTQRSEALGAPSSRDGSPSPLRDEVARRHSQTSIRRAWPAPEASAPPSFRALLHRTRAPFLLRREASQVERDRS